MTKEFCRIIGRQLHITNNGAGDLNVLPCCWVDRQQASLPVTRESIDFYRTYTMTD